MKANKIFAVLVTLFVLSTVLTSEASAQRHSGRHHGPMFKLGMLADELELTDEQQAKIEEQKFAAGKTAIELRSKIQIARLELHKLMHADNPDEGKIKSKVEEIGKLKTEKQLNRVESHLSMQKILTPEQKEKLRSLKKQRLHPGREFRHREGGRLFRNFHGGFDDDYGIEQEDEEFFF